MVSAFLVVWVALSFVIPLALNHWKLFFNTFVDYLIYFQIVSTLIFAYLITGGHLSEAKKHIKLIIVFTAVLVVLAFTYFRWTIISTNIEQYGNYLVGSEVESLFVLEDEEVTPFERETIFREGIANKYDIAFRQIAIFGGFVFASTFLLLTAMKREEDK